MTLWPPQNCGLGALCRRRRVHPESGSAVDHDHVGGTQRQTDQEALLFLQGDQPVYVADGFGGAADVARALGRDVPDWAPPYFPSGADAASVALRHLTDVAADAVAAEDGLEDAERRQLAVTHRPGNIASLVVVGLARLQRRLWPAWHVSARGRCSSVVPVVPFACLD